MISLRLFPLIVLLGYASFAQGELPSPRLDRITPMGAAAGSTIELEILGADLEEAKQLHFDHPGFRAEHVKDRKFRVTLAPDIPEGTYDVRVSGRYGISSPRLFAVSRGLKEHLEIEPNDDAETAQVITVPSAVNAVSDSNKDDFYCCTFRKGQRVVIEVFAGRLDSLMMPVLTLKDAAGKVLASNGGHYGRDPLVDCLVPADGAYIIQVNDLSYRGEHPYRLVITDQPHFEELFPRVVQVDHVGQFTAYGRNLGKGSKTSGLLLQDLPLDELRIGPDDAKSIVQAWKHRTFVFNYHPTGHSVLPTAATCTLTGFQVRGLPVLVEETPVTLEKEANDDPAQPQDITLPAVVSGRFDRERDADWYSFETGEGGPHSFEVYCERIRGNADPYLVVLDEKNNRVAELDDFGHRINAFDGHLRDPSGMVNLNAKSRYRVLVQDRYRRGGPRYSYVLTIRKPRPDFYPAVIHSVNPGPSGLNLRKGGSTYLDVVIHLKEGFNGPIRFTAEGLPRGVHMRPTIIENDTRGVLVLTADVDTPEFTGPIKLVARGKRANEVLEREVRAYTRVWNNSDQSSSRPTRELLLSIGEMSPFALRFLSERIEVEAGHKVEVTLQLSRYWPDAKAAVTVIPLSFGNAIKFSQVTIPEGKTETKLTLEIPANARPGEYCFSVLGQSQVPFAKDTKSTSKPNTLVSQASRPMLVVVKPPIKK